jgi:hypothetical protein
MTEQEELDTMTNEQLTAYARILCGQKKAMDNGVFIGDSNKVVRHIHMVSELLAQRGISDIWK